MYSLIIPVYKNEANIMPLLDALTLLAPQLDKPLQVVFVVDGSPDRSYNLLHDNLPGKPFDAELICLARNFGAFAAVRMGLEAAKGPFYAVMAADLQEPPELILQFFKTLSTEPVDITIGARVGRDDGFISRTLSNLFWRIYRKFIQADIPAGGVDIFGCNQMVRDALINLRESNSTLIGLLFWLGFRRKIIPYHRAAREIGKSAWTFRRKLRYLLDSCFALTDLPITILTIVGSLGMVVSLIFAISVMIAKLTGDIPVSGYTSLILVIACSVSAILLALGVIGNYVWRTFENTKQRPLFIPMLHETIRNHKENDGE